jgi:hypothetical protein
MVLSVVERDRGHSWRESKGGAVGGEKTVVALNHQVLEASGNVLEGEETVRAAGTSYGPACEDTPPLLALAVEGRLDVEQVVGLALRDQVGGAKVLGAAGDIGGLFGEDWIVRDVGAFHYFSTS